MISKLKVKNSIYRFHQYDKQNNFIQTYETIDDLITLNPSLRKLNIYQVCSGEKPSHGGYIWKKELKI